MKKVVMSMFVVILIITLIGCESLSKRTDMYIEAAQLSKQEKDILELLGTNNEQLIYDFKLDNDVKSLQINTYELINGTWKISSGSDHAFSDNKGRFVLKFENLAKGLRVAFQGEYKNGASEYSSETEEDFTGMSRATATLNNLTEITYEQEIPLAVQILTAQNIVSAYNVEAFFTPEKYEKNGYEHVYAITIRFSQKTLGELDRGD